MFGKESKADRYEFTNIGVEDVSLNETRGVEANLMHSPSSTDSATKVKTGLLSGSKHEIFVATSEWVHALLSVRGNPRMAEGTVKVKVRGNLDAALGLKRASQLLHTNLQLLQQALRKQPRRKQPPSTRPPRASSERRRGCRSSST